MKLTSKLFSLLILGATSCSAVAIDYNDPYWNNPNTNTDFVDQFNLGVLDRSSWDVITNVYVNGEDQDYQDVEYPFADWTVRAGQDDVDAVDGKVLNLKARYMDGVKQANYGTFGKPLFIRAGRIESRITDNTTFTYGKFEARIKMPPARNAEFPAWWLLGNFPDVGWTACQELDIIEFTGNNPAVAPQTHWQAPYTAYGGNPNNFVYANNGLDPSNQYITYGVVKTPEYIEFYINGVKTYKWGVEDKGQMPWPYVTPMRMILNHAITHVEWPAVGNYNKLSADPSVANKTGWTTVQNGVTMYEYIDTASMNMNIGRDGTDFLVDYVAHWPLPSSDPLQKYVDETKYSFFRPAGENTRGFYSLRGWMAPISVTADAFLDNGANANRDNGPKNAADGYVGSKWATPADDNLHSLLIDYGTDKPIKYFSIEWSWNLPASYDIYGKTSSGNWEYILTSTQSVADWATHVFDVNKTYRYIKLVTKGRIAKGDPIWLLEFKAFEDVVDVYPKPATASQIDRSVNVLKNGDFNGGMSTWNGENYDGSGAAYVVENGEVKITASTQGANSGSYQLHTSGFGLRKDHRYRVNFTARAAASRNMIVRASANDLNPSAQNTYLMQTVSLGTAATPFTYTFDFTAGDNPGRLAFLFGGMGAETVYIDDISIQEEAYIGVGETLVPAMDPTSFVAASGGWEWEWWGVAQRVVDGATGNKGSSTTGQEGLDQWIDVKIDPNYQIKGVSIAGDKSPARSLAQFKVEYGNGTTMLDWTNSTTDGVYEAFNTLLSAPPVGEQNFRFWFRPPAGQLVEVADAMLMGVDLKPHRIYTTVLDGGGSISPSAVVRYSNTNMDDATYTFTPPVGGSVANVIVDGVSQGALTQYTFTDISKNHDLAVSFTGGVASSSVASSSTSSAPVVISSSSSVSSSSAVTSSFASSVTSSAVTSSSSSSVASSVVTSSSSSSVASSVVTSSSSSSVASSAVTSSSSSSVASSVAISSSSSSVASSVVTSSSSSSVASSAVISSIASSVASSSLPSVGGEGIPTSSSVSSSSVAVSSVASSDVAVSSSSHAAVSSVASSTKSSSSVSSTELNPTPTPPTVEIKAKKGGGSIEFSWLFLLGLMCLMLGILSRGKSKH